MAETNFTDGLEYCNVHGHDMSEYKEYRSNTIHIRFEKCNNCGFKLKHMKYKYMGWSTKEPEDCMHESKECYDFDHCVCTCEACVDVRIRNKQ
jgi:hypothetical protein